MSKNQIFKLNKISIITPTLLGGGAERIAVSLANHFAECGMVVDLVVFNLTGPLVRDVSSNVNVVNFDVPKLRYSLFRLRGYLSNNKEALIISVIRDSSILISIASWGMKIKRLLFLEQSTMYEIMSKPMWLRLFWLTCIKASYYKATFIIANSHDTKSGLVSYKLAPISKTKVIPNPVLPANHHLLKNEKIDEEWLTNPTFKVIISVARLVPFKNHPFLIESFKDVYAHNKNARLIIIGEGPDSQQLCVMIARLNLDKVIKFIPFQNNIYPYYANADVFALTSNWEAFGNVIVEALSAGLPVVATDCPGGPRMILKDGKYGQLVPVGDKKLFVKALIDALEKPIPDRDVLIKYAENYTVSRIASSYYKLLVT